MNTIAPRNETEALLHEKLQALLADLDTSEQSDAAKQCPHCKKNGSPQTNIENADDKQQSHQDFPPSSPL